ncbi:hypothetical protein PaG_01010 [Moesziomyces aphidis]|jgi:oligosaccharyltransferase complex subunit gamma|uniref:Uncharacterized protein n=1 Tax=Moesziomyces aphidis TaxID=84754 RepID=W3VSQ3_MOEAP|nr:hypothetical protein PaG_01010 [Moesziomyces aphidis]
MLQLSLAADWKCQKKATPKLVPKNRTQNADVDLSHPREKKTTKQAKQVRTDALQEDSVEGAGEQQQLLPTRQPSSTLASLGQAAIVEMRVASRPSMASVAKLGLLALLCMLAWIQLPTALAQRFANKDQTSLYNRIQSSSQGFVDVDAKEFASIVGLPRDFAVSALLTTTNGGIKCPPCVAFQPEFEKVAQQWNRDRAVKSKHVFVKVEFSRAQQVFAQFQLQHAPVLYTFPAPTNTNAVPDHVSFDFNERGFAAKDVADHINSLMNTKFKFKQPVNTKLVTASITGVITLVGAIFFLAPYVPVLFKSSKPIWMLLCLGSMILFTSGHMWNSIRGAPYVAMGQGGKPEYFAAGFQSQYGVETQIVAAIYALLAFSFIALTVLVPAQRDPTRQRAGVYVWSAIFLATFSLLFYIFRTKNPSYPFRLFF